MTRLLAVVTGLTILCHPATALARQAPEPPKPAARPAAASAMTNGDVIKMIQAGLSDDIVISSIRHVKARRFDTSPTSLIGLKKAGASNAVIGAMLGNEDKAVVSALSPPSASPAPPRTDAPMPPPTATADAPAVPALVLAEDGLYFIKEDGIERIEAKTPYQTRTGSKLVSRLTFGAKPARLNAMLPALRAELQVGGSPSFYLHVNQGESVGEYYLVRFTVKEQQGRRELEVGSASFFKLQAGFAEKDLFLLDAKRLEKDVYLVTPKSGLPSGEYGLLQVPQATGSGQTGLTPRKIFDFGVR